jgi:hypothetical protein
MMLSYPVVSETCFKQLQGNEFITWRVSIILSPESLHYVRAAKLCLLRRLRPDALFCAVWLSRFSLNSICLRQLPVKSLAAEQLAKCVLNGVWCSLIWLGVNSINPEVRRQCKCETVLLPWIILLRQIRCFQLVWVHTYNNLINSFLFITTRFEIGCWWNGFDWRHWMLW